MKYISNKIILKNLNNKNRIQNQKISNIEYHIDQNLNFNIKELNKGNTNENLNKSYNKSINKLYNDLKKNINKKIIHNSFNNNPKKFKKDIFHFSKEDIFNYSDKNNNSFDILNNDSNNSKINIQNENNNITKLKRSITSRIIKHNSEKIKDIENNKRIFSITKEPKRKKELNSICKKILENPQKYFTTTLTDDMIKALGLDKKYLLNDTI